ncbi:TetR/AcrR family transcriptional regulator [Jannaschia aquimarina]|uniref:RutR_1 protein n=1 Tax=Jannaschia aquimarina TaxID=935700 RepID=A0A0D1CTJ4_9RHOB|nr:TetR/AcrR family transcriptional regulator [Jannaschia aquimarina]KIT18097.1 HTH-type transcriptional regulator RutR [Jannaschia aquimarina]SNT40789.1 transcriptional regulator, TetR family [Jannaschia aquimarina]
MDDHPETFLSPVKRARRAKIVAAARDLFVERGFRATTMEAVAATVGMSKVTVYGYFPDKDAVFLAVARAVAEEIEAAFDAALDTDGTVPDRVAAALVAKHALVARTVRDSIHAAELFAAKDRTAGAVFAALDARLEAAIATTLDRPGALDTARLLFAATQGIANAVEDDGTRDTDIGRLVHAVLA